MMISRRNFLAVAGAAAAAAALTACGGSSSSTASSAAASTSTAASTAEGGEKIVKVALTCDTGTIDDESFNQACWTAVSGYMGDDCQYYIPEADASDEDRETMIRQAVNDGADVIVCVGNAIKGADALPRYRRLAERLGGKVACTRPVFDRGVLPFKLVIGQSGTVVKPKLLLSFGVSGAVNHVTGFSDADVVVAVNTDPEAAIFNYCTYGIVGDMDEVCEAMLAKLGE